MKSSVLAALLLGGAIAGSGWDPAAQAELGRVAWRTALTALRAGDSTAALAQLRRAHEAWPAQPAYSEALVRLAARMGDTSTVANTLRLLAAQGLGAASIADSAVRDLAARSRSVATARAQLLAAVAGPARSTIEIVREDTLFFPEGLSVDPHDGTRFVTSLRHRNVWVSPVSGPGRWLLPENVAGRGAVFGVKLTADGRSLWLTLAPTPHMGVGPADSLVGAELWQVARESGRVLHQVRLGNGKGAPGELAIHTDGSVLVSDALQGRLYRLRVGATAVEQIESPLLRSPQGIAILAGGKVAIVADWSHGLLRWNLQTDEVRALEAPRTMALLGIDGLLMVDGALVAVQNGVNPMRILRIRVDSLAHRVVSVETLDRPTSNAGEFTVAAATGPVISYIASSSWPFWNDAAERIPNSAALPPVILRRFTLPE